MNGAVTSVLLRSAEQLERLRAGGPVVPEITVASLRRRAAAWLIDLGVVLCGLLLPLQVGVVLVVRAVTDDQPALALGVDGPHALAWSVAFVALWFVYQGAATSRPGTGNGRTVGRHLVGIRVVREDGDPIGAMQAWARPFLVAALVLLPFDALPNLGVWEAAALRVVMAVCVVWPALLGQRRQALGDRVLATIVVHDGPAVARLTPARPSPRPTTAATLVLAAAAVAAWAAAPVAVLDRATPPAAAQPEAR